MKKLIPIAVLSLTSLITLFAAPAQAVTTATRSFDVTVNLTSTCLVDQAASALDFGAYTSFGAPANTAPTTDITFKCTKGLSPASVVLDATDVLSTAAVAGATTTGAGVVSGLYYSLAVAVVVATPGAAATSSTGSGADLKSYTITGTMPSGQAGLTSAVTTGGAVQGTQARTLTLNF